MNSERRVGHNISLICVNNGATFTLVLTNFSNEANLFVLNIFTFDVHSPVVHSSLQLKTKSFTVFIKVEV